MTAEIDAGAVWAGGRFGKRSAGPPKLLFAQVREDAAVEASLLAEIPRPGVVFAIGSGGCTALSLLTAAPAKLYAVDVNPAQIYLLELKRAAFLDQGYDEVLGAMTGDARPVYPALRSALSAAAQAFWDRRGRSLARGLNHAGLVEQNLRRAMALFRLFVHGRRVLEALFQKRDLDAQRALYRRRWDTWRWRWALGLALNRAVLRLVYGRSALESLPADFAAQMKRQLDEVFQRFPLGDNGYLWQVFLGRYPGTERALPLYLQRAHHSEVVAGLARTTLVHAEASAWLAAQPPRSIDFFALSNILELSPPEGVRALLALVAARARPGALVCLRSIFPPRDDFASLLGDGLSIDRALGERAEAADRSPFCRFIQVLRKEA